MHRSLKRAKLDFFWKKVVYNDMSKTLKDKVL